MKKFWSDITNGTYRITCTGQTVYVYDMNYTELAKFRDLIYAYKAKFSPKGDIFIVKSTDGRFAIYSLKDLKLIKKFRFSKIYYSQDDNFIFYPDGNFLYSLERHESSLKTILSIYETTNFTVVKQLFKETSKFTPTRIEYNLETDHYYIAGYMKNEENCLSHHVVCKLENDNLTDIIIVPEKDYNICIEYLRLSEMGFTKKAKEFSMFTCFDVYDELSINNLSNNQKNIDLLKENNLSLENITDFLNIIENMKNDKNNPFAYDINQLEKENHSLYKLWKKFKK